MAPVLASRSSHEHRRVSSGSKKLAGDVTPGTPGVSRPLQPQPKYDEGVNESICKARHSWLKCNEVVDILKAARKGGLPFSDAPAVLPEGTKTAGIVEKFSVQAAWPRGVLAFEKHCGAPTLCRLDQRTVSFKCGKVYLYDRVEVKYFRNDGHNWRKKTDGKAVRETHEKLKLDQLVMLNCYYAHAIEPENLQVGCCRHFVIRFCYFYPPGFGAPESTFEYAQ
eukprot:scaffold113793_cov43-Prasinocladus_malaysianus.AAC.2